MLITSDKPIYINKNKLKELEQYLQLFYVMLMKVKMIVPLFKK